ncbi:MAG: hypothetical protein Q9163_000311 [Psora crenata]
MSNPVPDKRPRLLRQNAFLGQKVEPEVKVAETSVSVCSSSKLTCPTVTAPEGLLPQRVSDPTKLEKASEHLSLRDVGIPPPPPPSPMPWLETSAKTEARAFATFPESKAMSSLRYVSKFGRPLLDPRQRYRAHMLPKQSATKTSRPIVVESAAIQVPEGKAYAFHTTTAR